MPTKKTALAAKKETKSKAPAKAAVAVTRPLEGMIHVIRGQKVMLDSDLANLYGVTTKRLNEAVSRNPRRFSSGFTFQLTEKEAESLRSQIATSNTGRGGRRYLPHVFTEHGVVMLSAVLNSDRAIDMSILVVNAFVRMRELIAHNKDIAARVEKLESKQDRTVSVIEVLVEDIDRLGREVEKMKTQPPAKKRSIGFHAPMDDE